MERCSADNNTSSGNGGGIRKMERKDKERERRQQMKELCFHLSSLISNSNSNSSSSSTSKDVGTQQDNLEEAVTHILQLKEKVEKLRQIRDSKSSVGLRGSTKRIHNVVDPALMARSETPPVQQQPVIEVRSEDTNLEVALVSGLHNGFKLHQVIAVLEEEGAQVLNAHFSVLGHQVFYTIHSQALIPRIGVEASVVLERLQDLVS